MQSVDRAVYFLGNDRVLDFGVAAFESFRHFNPRLKAFLIPFNDDLSRTLPLLERYQIELVKDPVLSELHKIGESFWDLKHRDFAMLKKLYCFIGPARTFLFADCDVLFLESVDDLLTRFEASGQDFISFDPSVDYVYKPGVHRDRMAAQNSASGFNSGVFISRTGLVDLAELQRFYAATKAAREELADQRDQSMINHMVDSKQWKHINVSALDPDVGSSNNARHAPVRPSGNVYRLDCSYSPLHGKRFPFLHWNGIKLPGIIPNMLLFWRFRYASESLPARVSGIGGDIWHGRAALVRKVTEKIDLLKHRVTRRLGLKR